MSDLLLGPLVGGLNDRGAFLWGRASAPGVLSAWVGRRPDLADARLAGQSLPLTAENGFAGVAPVAGLQPDTRYFYALSLDSQPPGATADGFPEFTTFPTPGAPADFNFMLGSCFLPAEAEGGQIFNAIDHRREIDRLRFGLMIGDQIYADNWRYNGIGKVARSVADYRAVYAYTWSRPPLQRLLLRLPVFMTLDDHEIDDDWTWMDTARSRAQIPIWDRIARFFHRRRGEERRLDHSHVQAALKAYWEHQAMHAPAMLQPLPRTAQEFYALGQAESGSLAYTFVYGAAAFFVLDTRTMRIKSGEQSCILGERQWAQLQQWLLDSKDRYPLKFIVSSGSVLCNLWGDLAHDRWSGFPADQRRLLSFLAAEGIEGVFLLTGDMHSAHAVRAELYGPEGKAIPLWELCSSPFEQNPNWAARFTYATIRGAALKNQERKFVIAEPNFGIVRVTYDASGAPEVRFEVYNRVGECLAAVECMAD